MKFQSNLKAYVTTFVQHYIYLLNVHVCASALVLMWRLEDNFWEVALSFHCEFWGPNSDARLEASAFPP